MLCLLCKVQEVLCKGFLKALPKKREIDFERSFAPDYFLLEGKGCPTLAVVQGKLRSAKRWKHWKARGQAMTGYACVMVTGVLSPEEEHSQMVCFLDGLFSVALSMEKARAQPGDGNYFKGDVGLVEFDLLRPNCFCGFSHNCCKGYSVGVKIQVPCGQRSASKGAKGNCELGWVSLPIQRASNL